MRHNKYRPDKAGIYYVIEKLLCNVPVIQKSLADRITLLRRGIMSLKRPAAGENLVNGILS